jgi:hypothetical protein
MCNAVCSQGRDVESHNRSISNPRFGAPIVNDSFIPRVRHVSCLSENNYLHHYRMKGLWIYTDGQIYVYFVVIVLLIEQAKSTN